MVSYCPRARSYSFVLFLFAELASLRVVLQSFVSEEKLLARSKNEFFTAVDTPQHPIQILVHCGPPGRPLD